MAFRRHVGALDQRLTPGPRALRRAAWAGPQDSMPRAAMLSIHARVNGTEAASWEDPSLVQLWGPRYSVFVVPCDLAVFSLGTMPDDAKGRHRAEKLAADLAAALGDERIGYGEAGARLGVNPNRLRYAAATGTVLIRWEGARQPTVWTVPAPAMSHREARLELARRYLHCYGPATSEAFGKRELWTPRIWPGALLVDGERRDVASGGHGADRAALADAVGRGARCRRGRGSVPAPARYPGAGRRPLGRRHRRVAGSQPKGRFSLWP